MSVAVPTWWSISHASGVSSCARGAGTPVAHSRTSGEIFGCAPHGSMSRSASTTVLRTLPAPSSSTSTTSPSVSTPVPVGVPVRMTSPGSSVTNRVMSAMRSPKEKMRFDETSSCTTSPFTRVRRASPAGSTSDAATSGPSGV